MTLAELTEGDRAWVVNSLGNRAHPATVVEVTEDLIVVWSETKEEFQPFDRTTGYADGRRTGKYGDETWETRRPRVVPGDDERALRLASWQAKIGSAQVVDEATSAFRRALSEGTTAQQHAAYSRLFKAVVDWGHLAFRD